MSPLAYGLFAVGIAAYVTALASVGTIVGEIASDVGTAVMLILCGLTAIRFNRELDAKESREA